MLILQTIDSIQASEKRSLKGHTIVRGDVGYDAMITLEENSSLQICGKIQTGAIITSDKPNVFVSVFGHVESGALIQCHGNITVHSFDNIESFQSVSGQVIDNRPSKTEKITQKQDGSSSYSYVFKGPIHATGNSVTHFGPKFN